MSFKVGDRAITISDGDKGIYNAIPGRIGTIIELLPYDLAEFDVDNVKGIDGINWNKVWRLRTATLAKDCEFIRVLYGFQNA